MATEKLTRAVISGPLTAMDDAIRALMLDREFQPLQASTTLGGRGELQVPPTSPALCSTARSRCWASSA